MSLINILRTTSFRLVAVYLGVFTASVIVLGVVVYFSVGRQIEIEVDERLKAETRDLQNLFRSSGIDALIAEVQNRTIRAASLDYRLEDHAGNLIAGNLPTSRADDGKYTAGWIHLAESENGPDADSDTDWELALVSTLSNGDVLVVGQDLSGVIQARHAVLVAFAWALLATLILGTVGGIFLSGGFLRRIDAMSAAAAGIIAGNLRQRIPSSDKNDELGRLAETFNHMFDRIETLIEANRHVSHNIAHDLRRPLARIVRRLERARDSDLQRDSYKATIDLTIGDINGVLDTFTALLRIAQIETGARRAAFRHVDFAAIAREVAEAFQPAADEQGKTLTVKVEAPLPIAGDKELLSQLVANLVDNALRHTPTGSVIRVSTARNLEVSTLVIADSGAGVPEKERSRIFDRFYRLDASRTTPGDGLGLSLVAAVAELHGIEIALEDNHPGLRVVMKMPRTTQT